MNGGAFIGIENIFISSGIISMPFGAFDCAITFPRIAIEVCSLISDISSYISSEHCPFFAMICKSPSLSLNIIN
jgi:hypothetical protein